MIQSLKKVFGGGKSYYLELDDAEQGKAPVTAAPETPPASPEAPSEQLLAAAEAPPEAEKKAGKKAAKQAAATAPMPEPAAAPEPPPEPEVTAFASNYLLPVTSLPSRRRPGPSLVKFLDMARDINTR